MGLPTQDQWLNEEYINRRAQALSALIVPSEIIHKEFKELFHRALKFNSLLRLKCGMITFHAYVFLDRELVYPEMELALDVLRVASPVEMEQTLEENFQMLVDVVEPMADKLRELGTPVEEKIRRELKSFAVTQMNVPIQKQIFKR